MILVVQRSAVSAVIPLVLKGEELTKYQKLEACVVLAAGSGKEMISVGRSEGIVGVEGTMLLSLSSLL